jgi:general secretion pathway protein G
MSIEWSRAEPDFELCARSRRRAIAWLPLGLVAIVAVGMLVVLLCFRGRFVATGKKAEMDVVSISSAVDAFIVIHFGVAPEGLDELVHPDERGHTLLLGWSEAPRDPWGRPYRYEPLPREPGYRVFTLGRDGVPGGSGEDADIDNFTMGTARR